MPRDSSGNYTLPSGINPVVDGTIISTDWANPTLSDIATQLNNVLTRDGLLGPVAPLFIVDGTPSLPGLAFNSQNGTGWWRDPTKVGFSYAGVTSFTVNGSGLSPVQPVGFPNGTVALPSITFATETNTGVFRESSGVMAWSIAGTKRMSLTASSLTLAANAILNKVDAAIVWNQGGPNLAVIQYVDATGQLGIVGNGAEGIYLENAGAGYRFKGPSFSPNSAFACQLGSETVPWAGVFGSVHYVRSGGAAIGYMGFNGGLILDAEPGQPIRFATNSSVRMNIANDGNVSIGQFFQFTPPTDADYRGAAWLGTGGTQWGSIAGSKNPGPGGSELSFASGTVGGGTNDGFMTFLTSGALRMLISAAGPVSVYSTGTGTLQEVGYRNVPTIRILSTLNEWIVPTDRGGLVKLTNQPQLNTNVMSTGDIVTLLNISGATQTINVGPGFTLRIAGTNTTGPRTLVDGGMATIWWDDPTYAWISGSGLS